MNAEEPAGNQEKAADVQPAPAGEISSDPRRQGRGRGGRFRRGGRGRRDGRDGRDNRADREPREPRPEGEGRSEPQSRPDESRGGPSSNIRKAVEQVLHVRTELRKVLDEIHEILQTLERAEREKTASEDEIETLRESLRGLHREPSYPRHRSQPVRPAPAPAPVVSASEEEDSGDDEVDGDDPDAKDDTAKESED